MADVSEDVTVVDTLPPLILPNGLSAYHLAELLTNVLLRKVNSSDSPWVQWILLAALDILHGRTLPTMDTHTLYLLQPTLKQEVPPQPQVPLLLDQSSQTVIMSPLSATFIPGMDENRNILEFDSKHYSDSGISRGSMDCQDTDEFLVDIGVPSQLPSKPEPPKSDIGVQVTPKIMGNTATKWVQVKKPQKVNKRMQTTSSFLSDHKHSPINSETQTESEALIRRLMGGCGDKETQTLVKILKEESSQTLLNFHKDECSQTQLNLHKDECSQTLLNLHKAEGTQTKMRKKNCNPNWELIPISGLPRKRNANGELKYPKVDFNFQQREYLYYDKKENAGSTLNYSPLYTGFSGSYDSNTDIVSGLSDSQTLLFHGRPLVKSKSECIATKIPQLLAKVSHTSFGDPRLQFAVPSEPENFKHSLT